MAPDFSQLAKHEDRMQQLAERREAREHELEVIPCINVMGSTAGAGSGEFHMYRGYRNKEMARLEDMERERKQSKAQGAWEEERSEAVGEQEEKTSKAREKRKRKKEQQKEKQIAEKAAKKANKAADGGAAAPAGGAAGAGESE